MDGDRQRGAITVRGGVHSAERHDSAHKHVTGAADYIDDMVEPVGTLHAYLGLSEVAHGVIASIDLSAVRAAPGVVDVLTAADIPAVNDVSPVHAHDDPVFAEDTVMFWGQPVFAVIAESREHARRAAALARIEYRPLDAAINIDAAIAAGGDFVTKPLKLERGSVDKALAEAPNRITGKMETSGQGNF